MGDLMHKYNPLFFAGLVSLCILGFVLAGIASALPHYTTLDPVLNAISGTVLVADMLLVLIADWKGFLTLNGLINWSNMSDSKRILFGILYCVFGPLLLILYLIQIARYKPLAMGSANAKTPHVHVPTPVYQPPAQAAHPSYEQGYQTQSSSANTPGWPLTPTSAEPQPHAARPGGPVYEEPLIQYPE